ncbi:uncharacterized protein MONBRDRAFT_24290 [Monosiga brevicollis MX1]|uniref:Uncharacterized protein n=1 Tax=Monosiga brevicollis TaxID=81824 RepID=A9UVZ2_MONBE|nr:uncharacterized protein MONBRDRAFT_24290 [Monosiga brevicollis MX1]EDQ90676.1 predicted protein [Monosiga brevicollis MX1]|eukprot:XP_001744727.1 hypothetical protein [Monosiga brevicollis MX1]
MASRLHARLRQLKSDGNDPIWSAFALPSAEQLSRFRWSLREKLFILSLSLLDRDAGAVLYEMQSVRKQQRSSEGGLPDSERELHEEGYRLTFAQIFLTKARELTKKKLRIAPEKLVLDASAVDVFRLLHTLLDVADARPPLPASSARAAPSNESAPRARRPPLPHDEQPIPTLLRRNKPSALPPSSPPHGQAGSPEARPKLDSAGVNSVHLSSRPSTAISSATASRPGTARHAPVAPGTLNALRDRFAAMEAHNLALLTQVRQLLAHLAQRGEQVQGLENTLLELQDLAGADGDVMAASGMARRLKRASQHSAGSDRTHVSTHIARGDADSPGPGPTAHELRVLRGKLQAAMRHVESLHRLVQERSEATPLPPNPWAAYLMGEADAQALEASTAATAPDADVAKPTVLDLVDSHVPATLFARVTELEEVLSKAVAESLPVAMEPVQLDLSRRLLQLRLLLPTPGMIPHRRSDKSVANPPVPIDQAGVQTEAGAGADAFFVPAVRIPNSTAELKVLAKDHGRLQNLLQALTLENQYWRTMAHRSLSTRSASTTSATAQVQALHQLGKQMDTFHRRMVQQVRKSLLQMQKEVRSPLRTSEEVAAFQEAVQAQLERLQDRVGAGSDVEHGLRRWSAQLTRLEQLATYGFETADLEDLARQLQTAANAL